jgi:hypothetical protein
MSNTKSSLRSHATGRETILTLYQVIKVSYLLTKPMMGKKFTLFLQHLFLRRFWHSRIQYKIFPAGTARFLAERKSMIVRCSPDWNELNAWLEASDIPPLPGAGKYQWKISTANDSAQFYFNQGINAYYGFHIIEAMASFAKASRFDPECAMLYWAQALAYGPNINDFGYIASPAALDALEKANAFSGKASGFEKALIAAISVRYVADSADATRKNLNESYTAKWSRYICNSRVMQMLRSLCRCHDAGASLGFMVYQRHTQTMDPADPGNTRKNFIKDPPAPGCQSLLHSCDGALTFCRQGPAQCRKTGHNQSRTFSFDTHAFPYFFKNGALSEGN